MKVELIPTTIADIQQQSQLMLTGGEPLDLLPVMSSSVSGFMDSEFLLDMSEYIDKEGYNTRKYWGDYAKIASYNGIVYGVPMQKEYATPVGFMMRRDILNELGIDIAQYEGKGLAAFEEVFEKVHEKYPDMTVIGPIGDLFGKNYTVDSLSDGFGVLMNYGQDTTVVNYYESQEFADICKTARSWYEKGYIMKDAATATMTGTETMKAGNLFCFPQCINPKSRYAVGGQCGYEMVDVAIWEKRMISTDTIASLTYSIAQQSQDPEKAFAFLDWAIGSAQFNNLLIWGIEGEHYVIGEDGTAKFPEGKDALSAGYHRDYGFASPNQMIAELWDGFPANTWEKFKAFNDGSINSKALGFRFDASEFSTEIAALTSVQSEYLRALTSGSVDPEKELANFNAKLKEADIDTVISAKQKQLDVWLQK